MEQTLPENTGQIQAGRFQPGQSGNPAGKPKGARHKATLAAQELLDGEVEIITRKVIELAKDGDMAAIRLVLERILPPRKDAAISFALPPIATMEDITNAIASIIQAVSDAEITPSEGQAVASLLEQHRKSIESTVLMRKLGALQAILQPRK